MDKYTDNYMTDDNDQRWAKLQYAQTYATRASDAEKEIERLQSQLDIATNLLEEVEEDIGIWRKGNE